MSQPVLIFTPGAWHTPEPFVKVTTKLQDQGYKCVGVSLPSVGRDPPVQNMDADIAAVRDAVLQECDAGNDVIVCCHSWGGLIGSCALEGLGKEERAKEGKKGVLKIVFIAAFVVPVGVSTFDAVGGQIPALWNVDGDQVYASDPIPAFYHDVDPAEAEWAVSLLKPHAKATKYTPATAAAYMKIPSVYLICEDDRAMPPFAQEAMVKQAKESGANMEVERVATGHSPFLVRPDFVVDFMKRAISSAT